MSRPFVLDEIYIAHFTNLNNTGVGPLTGPNSNQYIKILSDNIHNHPSHPGLLAGK